MFSASTYSRLNKLLNSIINNEVLSENLRQKLARRPNFNIVDAFKALDKYDKGYATLEDIKNLLTNHGIKANGTELFALIKRYDRCDSGKISFTDFVKEIAPKSPTKY